MVGTDEGRGELHVISDRLLEEPGGTGSHTSDRNMVLRQSATSMSKTKAFTFNMLHLRHLGGNILLLSCVHEEETLLSERCHPKPGNWRDCTNSPATGKK